MIVQVRGYDRTGISNKLKHGQVYKRCVRGLGGVRFGGVLSAWKQNRLHCIKKVHLAQRQGLLGNVEWD